jgi:hypothetical protein
MPIMTRDEMRALHQRYCNTVNFINEINHGFPNYLKIKQVQIPSSFTQSLAYYYLLDNPNIVNLDLIPLDQIHQGNNQEPDFIIHREADAVSIEVKATGTNIFQRLRPNALLADFIIWINFYDEHNYDIGVFDPVILEVDENGEAPVTWDELQQCEDVFFDEGLYY